MPREIETSDGQALIVDPGAETLPLTPDAHRARGTTDVVGRAFFGGGCIHSEGLGGGLRRNVALHESLHIPTVACIPAGQYFLVASPDASTLRGAKPSDPGWWEAGSFPEVTVSSDVEHFLCDNPTSTAPRATGTPRQRTTPAIPLLTGAGAAAFTLYLYRRRMRRPEIS